MRISKNLPTNPESFKENHPYYVREIKKKINKNISRYTQSKSSHISNLISAHGCGIQNEYKKPWNWDCNEFILWGVRIQGFVGDKDEFAFPYPARSNVGMYNFLFLFTPIS